LIKDIFFLGSFAIYRDLIFHESCFPSGTLFSALQAKISVVIRINAAIFLKFFSSVLKYLIQSTYFYGQ
jgi:hypothetical protein